MSFIDTVSVVWNRATEAVSNSVVKIWTCVSDCLAEIPDGVKKPFWYSTTTAPTVFTFILSTAYLYEYFVLTKTLILISALLIAMPIGVLCVKFRSCFAVFVLCVPELIARVLRIYLIQLALVYSPMPQIQTNMQTFLKAYTCTTDVALQAGQKASNHLISTALNVGKGVIKSLNDLSTEINDSLFVPFDGINKALDEIGNIFLQIGQHKEKCGNSLNDFNNFCRSIVSIPHKMCKSFNFFNIKSMCADVETLENKCNAVSDSNLCSVFTEMAKPKLEIEKLQKSVKWVKSEFSFGLGLNYSFDTGIDNNTINGVRESFDEHIKEKFDTLILCKQIFSFLVATSVLYILITKARLVRKYSRKETIRCGKISKLFLASNPIIIQLLILCLLAFLDFGLRYIYEMQQVILEENVIELGTQFSASVSNRGGSIGIALASAVSQTFQMYDSMKMSLDLSSCYETKLEPPSNISYLLVAVGLFCGICTYGLDIYFRKRQIQMIEFADKWYDNVVGSNIKVSKYSGVPTVIH